MYLRTVKESGKARRRDGKGFLKMILITFDYIICFYKFVDFVFHSGLT